MVRSFRFTHFAVVAAFITALSFAAPLFAADGAYPATPKKPVTDVYHGVSVTDDYRWLEDDNAAEVKDWIAAQNAVTRKQLDASPIRADIVRRVQQLLGQQQEERYDMKMRGGRVFAMRRSPGKSQPVLVVLPPSLEIRQERVVLDPVQIDPSGRTTIDFFRPSFDGRLVAVSLSKDGSEDGTAYVFDVSTGRRLPDSIPRVTYPTGGGSIEWSADGKGFFYTRYPRPGERAPADAFFYMEIWYHRLGTPIERDRYMLGKEFPRIAEVALEASRDGLFLLAEVRNGDGGEIAWYVRNTAGKWARVADHADEVKHAKFGEDGRLYLLTVKDAPLGRVIAVPLTDPRLARAKEVVAPDTFAAETLALSRTRLYVRYRAGGPSVARVFTLDGTRVGEIPAERISEVEVLETLDRDRALVQVASYTAPPQIHVYDARANKLTPTALAAKPNIDFNDATVDAVFAQSPDGTRVPMWILRKKDTKLDGRAPMILHGYGGYGISMEPRFRPLNRLWLDYGGMVAVIATRGGGEYGEPWHRAGMLTRKQNVFDDFAAGLRYLVENNYTRPERLATLGGSNGGLLMGAALTQHPEAMRAVVAMVGIFDSLRSETTPNGQFNVTEYGSTKDPAQFKALYDYSPLLRVRDGTAYPAVLLTSGDNDGRVAPYESRKMAARLQAATASQRPVLLRTDAQAGHGAGTSLSGEIALWADVFTFLADQLGVEAPARP